jgi:hypothetical protein
LPDSYIEALQPLDNVGEIMVRFLIDEDRLRYMLSGQGRDSLSRVQIALDRLMLEVDQPKEEPKAAAPAPVVVETAEDEDDALVPAAFADEVVVETPTKPEAPKVAAVVAPAEEVDYGDLSFEDEEDTFAPATKETQKKKKERQQRRELVFDEDRGVQLVKRKRKGSRQRDQWDTDEE